MIKVVIYGDLTQNIKGCGGCRSVMSMNEAVYYMRKLCSRRYGNEVSVEFVDVHRKNLVNRQRQKATSLRAKNYNVLPIVEINGNEVSRGNLDYRLLLKEIGKMLGSKT